MIGLSRGILLVGGILAMLGAGPAWAQENFDAGKTPAELYASDCAICHKTPHGLAKNGTEGFLSEHYTASKQAAAAIAGYLKQVGGGSLPSAKTEHPVKRASTEKEKAKEGLKPGEKKPEAEKAGEHKPGEAKATEHNPTEHKRTEHKPAEHKTTEAKATERKATERKTAEHKHRKPKTREAKAEKSKTGKEKAAEAKIHKPKSKRSKSTASKKPAPKDVKSD